MFVKKLVEKASSKKHVGNLDGLKPADVDPRVLFHYGIPAGSNLLAYDPIQKILAISTQDGRIKLFGRDNTQALLESKETVSSKFSQFFDNQGILLSVNLKNHIEVWDIDRKLMVHMHDFQEEITSFTAMQHSLYMYVGDSVGNVSVFMLDQEAFHITQMKYSIPSSESRGNVSEAARDTAAVTHILPQPTAERKRLLIVFKDGFIVLWDIRESKAIFTTGGSTLQSLSHEPRKVTCVCWACPLGSKVVVGYSTGEIFIWRVPQIEIAPDSDVQNAPSCKLNLGYKMDKIPIASLKWSYADGKASRLYVMGGASDVGSSNLLQVVLLNDQTESRTIKLPLHLIEPCFDMEIISGNIEQNKSKQNLLLLLGKSGHVYAYDDYMIEKYLLQCQSRSPPSCPKEIVVKLPFVDSSITTAKFITNNSHLCCSTEDSILLAKNVAPLLPFDVRSKDGSYCSNFSGFTKIKNLYITGHSDGAINFWDVSCPSFVSLLSLKQQSEDDFSLSGVAITALYYDSESRLLVSGDHNGTVRVFRFKPEPFVIENSFMSLQGNAKKGNSHIIHSVKVIKVNGAVLSINASRGSGHLAVGSDQGYVSVIDVEGFTILYQKLIASELCTGIISLQFETCTFHGFEKNVLVVATKDSSVLALESDNGNALSTTMVQPKKPSKSIFMQILDEQNTGQEDSTRKHSSVLICSEKAAYVYSLEHLVQGVKKVNYKKKYHSSTCCWASTFYCPSDIGLILLFTSGKIEIRSLPDLSLLKESYLKGFTFPPVKLNSLSDISISSSRDGELILVNGDQEIFFLSVLLQKESYRLLDYASHVYTNDLVLSPEGPISGTVVQKEKKKGLFSSVIKDFKGGKPKNVSETNGEEARENIQDLSSIFAFENFPSNTENINGAPMDEHDIELDIDDIDIDGHGPVENPKGQKMMATLNKEKLASKFQAFKGKFKQMTVKNGKTSAKEEQIDEKNGSVDQIKKKYGFYSANETCAAKTAANKLNENLKKLQGIRLRTTEMQDTAKTFSSMAKDVLQTAEHEKRNT